MAKAKRPKRVEAHTPREQVWARRMLARDPSESHRASTPLELLFDLCFVVAVAEAGSHLHHGLSEGHAAEAVPAFVLAFFAIWWAWMNFTWFASAYDTDDVAYRLLALAQIAGALVLAAGIPRAFERTDYGVVTLGYTILRASLVTLWLRASRSDGARRRTARRYAIGLVACQLGWISLLALPARQWPLGFLVLAPAEMLVPIWAERAKPTSWHPHHVAERYGLFTLIVIGESILAATLAIQAAVDAGDISPRLMGVIVGGLLIVSSMWWIYFDEPAHRLLVTSRDAFVWGYSHLLVFGATAAVGAGLAVSADFAAGHGHGPWWTPGAAVGVPVALYTLGVWAVQIRPLRRGRATAAYMIVAVLALAAAASEWAVPLIGAVLCALVATTTLARLTRRAR